MKSIKSILSYTNKLFIQKNTSQIHNSLINTSLKSFSTIRLKTHNGVLQFTHNEINPDAKLKNYLSKNWVLLKNSYKYNKISKDSNYSNDENEKTLVSGIGKLTQVDFERFAVKTGLGLSNSENVYIVDGVFKGKKVRFVAENPEDIARLNSIPEEQGNFDDAEILVLVNNIENKDKRFILFDKSRKIVLTNSQSVEKIKNVLVDLSA